MASSLKAEWEGFLLELFTRKMESLARPNGFYVALFTTAPSRTAAGTEAALTRLQIIPAGWTPTAGTEGAAAFMVNNETLYGAPAAATVNGIKACAACTAVTGGEQFLWGTLTVEKNVAEGETPIFKPEELKLSLS
jgi:hypothetical protein